MYGGFQEDPQLGPHDAGRRQYLGQLNVCLALFLNWENYVSISFHIEWDMVVVTVFLSIFWTKWISIWFKIERKTVTTIISHSMRKEIEI